MAVWYGVEVRVKYLMIFYKASLTAKSNLGNCIKKINGYI